MLQTDDVLSLDPNKDNESVTTSVLFNVYEGLVGFDDELKVRPALAESWEHETPERWRFRLRRGVRFHDGSPLTADLVRDLLLALRGDSEKDAAYFLSQVRDVEAPDAATLDIVTREPRALLASLPFVYVTRRSASGGFPPLVGTGPYRVAEWSQGHAVRLERFDGHWGERPAIREATFAPMPDARARVAALRGGQADLVCGVPPELAREPAPGLRFVRRAGLTVHYLGFRVGPGSPFHDVRVRRAIHLALDRKAIIVKALAGAGAVPTQPVAPLVYGYNPDLAPPAVDLERAGALLREAGLPRGFKTRLDFHAARASTADLVREQLARIGIDVGLNGLAAKRDLYALGHAGGTDFFLVRWDCSSGEAAEFYEFCLHTPTRGFGRVNYGGYSSRRIDEIVETQSALLDPRERQAALQKAAVIAMEDLPVVPLYLEDDVYGVRAGVQFRPRAARQVRIADVRFEASP